MTNMNEKQKMINGLMYNPEDITLKNERKYVKNLCLEYNSLTYEDAHKKNEYLNKILGRCGNNITIEPNFFCDYGYNIKIGDNFYSNHNLVILDPAPITFGNNVFIGPNCGFYSPSHPINPVERNSYLEYAKPIKIGNNVWFGGNITVLGGVTIGNNAVIGAGSVVTKDIPANTIAFGNPCKPRKSISL